MINQQIMVYSPPRTGSTLIWQCLTKIFTKVLKSHRNSVWDCGSDISISTKKQGAVLDYSCPCVITERDPVDCFFSQWRNDNHQSETLFQKWLGIASENNSSAHKVIDNASFNIKKFKELCDTQMPLGSIREVMRRFRQHLEDLKKIKRKYAGPVLVLQYERFWNYYDYIFTNLEDFFNITFSEETKTKIRNTTKRSVNKSIQKKLKKSGNYDFETHIHGGHIFLSEPGYSNKIFGQKNLERIQKLLECNVEEIMHIDLDK